MNMPVVLSRISFAEGHGDPFLSCADGSVKRLAEVAPGATMAEPGRVSMPFASLEALVAFVVRHANAPAVAHLMEVSSTQPTHPDPAVERIADALRACRGQIELTEDTEGVRAELDELAEAIVALPITPPKDRGDHGLSEGAGFFNSVRRVMFRAGLLVGRELVARALAAELPRKIELGVPYMTHAHAAALARRTWPAELGEDPGVPRQLRWDEVADGDGTTSPIKLKDISPSVEALPQAWSFLLAKDAGNLASPAAPATATEV